MYGILGVPRGYIISVLPMKKHIIAHYLSGFLPVVTAEAHCDIPCGVYDPTAAKLAAKTVARMAMQIGDLKEPAGDAKALMEYHNHIARRVKVKEDHAELCKKELFVLWADFFKPEHLESYPDLHDIFWKAIKLAGKNKQGVDVKLAEELCEDVDSIAKIFYEVRKAPEKFEAYKVVTDKLW